MGLSPRGLLACLDGEERPWGEGTTPQHRLTLSQGSLSAAKPPGRDAAESCPGWQRNPESLLQAGEPLKTQTRPLACVCLVCQLGL